MSPLALALSTALLLESPGAGPPLVSLAETLARELGGAARGRSLEIAALLDRTGRGGTLSGDLRSLLEARLRGRVRLAETGPRLRLEWVLFETPHRLGVSARLLEEPGGSLVDVLTASAEVDAGFLALFPALPNARSAPVEVVSASRSAPLPEAVLDLAFVGDDRLLVLAAEALALYRLESLGLTLESRQALPGPFAPVRTPGGRLVVSSPEASVWALTSPSSRAVLFGLDGRRLAARQEARALPWPGAPSGLTYRPGTNLLEGSVLGLGPGPFLAVAGGEGVAEDGDGRLSLAGPEAGTPTGIRAGPALVWLGPGLLAASSPAPPDGEDQVQLLLKDASGLRALDPIPVPGSIEALAARAQGPTVLLLAALRGSDGARFLWSLELRRREP